MDCINIWASAGRGACILIDANQPAPCVNIYANRFDDDDDDDCLTFKTTSIDCVIGGATRTIYARYNSDLIALISDTNEDYITITESSDDTLGIATIGFTDGECDGDIYIETHDDTYTETTVPDANVMTVNKCELTVVGTIHEDECTDSYFYFAYDEGDSGVPVDTGVIEDGYYIYEAEDFFGDGVGYKTFTLRISTQFDGVKTVEYHDVCSDLPDSCDIVWFNTDLDEGCTPDVIHFDPYTSTFNEDGYVADLDGVTEYHSDCDDQINNTYTNDIVHITVNDGGNITSIDDGVEVGVYDKDDTFIVKCYWASGTVGVGDFLIECYEDYTGCGSTTDKYNVAVDCCTKQVTVT